MFKIDQITGKYMSNNIWQKGFLKKKDLYSCCSTETRIFYNLKLPVFSIIWGSTVYEDHVWERGSPFKETHVSFVKPFIVWMQMFLFFFVAGTLHLIHYPRPAREIAESESIQKDQDRDRCSAELSLN